jgi:glutaconate CoA-transferase subunit B
MRLKSVHPGHTVDEVINATGFELVIPDEVPETPLPTDEELSILRTRVDPTGTLRS